MPSFSFTALACLIASALPGGLGTEIPQLRLNLTPLFKGASVSSLNVTLELANTSFKANSTMLSYRTSPEFTQAQNYDAGYLKANDRGGLLPLIAVDDTSQTQRSWKSGRDPKGDIAFSFVAVPRDHDLGIVARADLRFDSGGLFGMMQNSVPFPPDDGKQWNITINWDIPESAPAGTRFASSLGEGPSGSAVGYPSQILGLTHFAVGPLKRWPDWDQDSRLPGAGSKRSFAMFWIGDLAWDIDQLGPSTQASYLGTSKYFNEFKNDFRVFLRQEFENQYNFGGIGGHHSFLLEYLKDSPNEYPVDSINNLLSHEMVHNFALTYPFDYYNTWYQEGMAEYLSSVGPYAGGTLDKTTFVAWLNDKAQGYYTESPLGRTWDSLVKNYWEQSTAVAKAPYTRGFMYIAYVQSQIVQATQGQHSVDDVIRQLYQMYVDGQDVSTSDFIASASRYLGKQVAQDSFDTMINGTLLVPRPDGFAKAGLKMARHDKLKFDLGFNETSMGRLKVTGLVKGSRAEKAGLREGDAIVHYFATWTGSNTYNSTMQIVVTRNGKNETIEYWPRSNQLVEAWEWEPIS